MPCETVLIMLVLDILEFSGIAWPNPGMWTQAQSHSIQGPVSGAQRPIVPEVKEDEDAHAHSPRRPSQQDVCVPAGFNSRRYPDYEDYWANQSMPPPPARADAAAWNQPQDSDLVRQNGALADPFLEPRGLSTVASRRGKKSSEDTPMPDVPSYEASRNMSGMTGVRYEHNYSASHDIASHEAIMNQLVEALSPLKSDDGGPHNPTNSPSSGRLFSRPSTAAQARAVSRRVTSSGGPSPITDRKRNVADDNVLRTNIKIISVHPGGSVQSKKEGEDNKENTPDHRVAGADFTRHSSLSANAIRTKSLEKVVEATDSKRKRPLEDTSISVQHKPVDDDSISSSPSKKVSKMASAEVLRKGQSPHTPDGRKEVTGSVSLGMVAGRG